MHTLFFSPFAAGLGFGIFLPLLILLVVAVIVLKGYALWYSARAGQKWWFIAMLVVNTVGILEIIYLIWFRPRSLADNTNEKSTPTDSSAA